MSSCPSPWWWRRPPRQGIPAARAVAVLTAAAVAIGACSSPAPTTAVLLVSRAGPVMDEDAPVTLQGAEVGKVAETEALPDRNVLHLAIDSAQLHLIPANVLAKIAAPTAVQLILPADPSPQRVQAGQILQAQ